MFINMQFFANRNIGRMKSTELQKSIASWKEQEQLHIDKLQNPEQYYPNWNQFDQRYQNGLKKHWEHEIATFRADIEAALEELRKRGDTYGG